MDEYIDFGYDIGKDLQNAYNEGYAQGKADAVKHAYWRYVGYYECSSCLIPAASSRPVGSEHFCYNCGAKMDVEG